MAELLVIRHDKTPGFTPGDVIVVKPDGWEWSDRERNGGSFTVVEVPGMSVEDAEVKFLTDGTPPEVRKAQRDEWARFQADTIAAKTVPAEVAPLDVAKFAPKAIYPQRAQKIDVVALDGKPKTEKEISDATIAKAIAVVIEADVIAEVP